MKFIEQTRTHTPAQTDFVRQKFLDIPYAPEDSVPYVSRYAPKCQPEPKGPRRLLDIYLPNEGNGPFPVIVDIFGGGWCFGHKSSHKLEPALNLLKRGFAVVSANYSLSYQARFPAQIYELKAAIRFIRKNSAKYNLDPDRIALLGESAGAHLAAVTACSAASGKLEDSPFPDQDVSDAVQAVIALYCPVDIALTKEYFLVQKALTGQDTLLQESGEADSVEALLLGGTRQECPEIAQMANPENYLSENCPPFLFLHGDLDQVVPIVGTMGFAGEIMGKTSIDNVRFQIVHGAHHNILDFEKEWIYDLEAAFLREKLRMDV